MRVTADIIREEFIGTQATISKSPHQDYIGIHGQVIGETRNTFKIQQKPKNKSIIKDQAIFQFQFNDGTIVEIDGKLLVGKPEDRLKKTTKRLW